jgi:hypothetical protein
MGTGDWAYAGALFEFGWATHFGGGPVNITLSMIAMGFMGFILLGFGLEEPLARRWDARIERYDQFTAALRAFEAWERRTHSEFWRSLSGHQLSENLPAYFESKDTRFT